MALKMNEHSDSLEKMLSLSKRIAELEEAIRSKKKDISRLQHMNSHLQEAQQKRDEIIASALEENRKLKENLRMYQRMVQMKETNEESPRRSIARPNKPPVVTVVEVNSQKFESKQGTLSLLSLDSQTDNEYLQKLRLFENIVEDEENFIDNFLSLDVKQQHEFIDMIKNQKNEYKNLEDLTSRLRKLIRSSHTISVSLILDEAMERIVSETCDTLNCDRASVFLVDELNGELWTKAAKGTNIKIRIPMDKGTVGWVATHGEALRIEDAYQDTRFNKAIDIQTNYRTKTILAIPIRDNTGSIIGVCQAINKLDGLFTPDDQALFELLADQAGIMLRNSMTNEMSNVYQHKLKHMLNIYKVVLSCNSLQTLLPASEKELRNIMSTDMGVIYIVNIKKQQLIRYIDGRKVTISMQSGIAGHVAQKGKTKSVPDMYINTKYNGKVDLDTSMPVLCMPIKNQQGTVQAVLQVVNLRGVVGRAVTNRAKLDHLDDEMLKNFCELFTVSLERIHKIKQIQKSHPQQKLKGPYAELFNNEKNNQQQLK